MKTRTLTILTMVLAGLIISCDKPTCVNENSVFDNYAIDSKEYNLELSKQIQSIGAKNLSYRFEKYFKKGSDEFIEINIHGKSLCAKSIVKVNSWGKTTRFTWRG